MTCQINKCDEPVYARGMCSKHYQRWLKHKDPLYCTTKYHGMTGTTEHTTWHMMRQRCSNPNHRHYHHYGGRGIRVCPRWDKSFLAFFEDMGKKPIGSTLDRIDNDGDYEPNNCRWADRFTQGRNKQNTILISYMGETKPLIEWATILCIDYTTLFYRFKSNKAIDPEQLFAPPRHINRTLTHNGKTKTISEWANELGISYRLISERIRRHPEWPMESILSTKKYISP